MITFLFCILCTIFTYLFQLLSLLFYLIMDFLFMLFAFFTKSCKKYYFMTSLYRKIRIVNSENKRCGKDIWKC